MSLSNPSHKNHNAEGRAFVLVWAKRILIVSAILGGILFIYFAVMSNALIMACSNGEADKVSLLLSFGASANTTDESTTVLMSAVQGKHDDVVKVLVEQGANVNTGNYFGYTPLMSAASNGDVAIVKYLFAHGANANAKNIHGQTAFQLAVQNDHSETAAVLEQPSAK